MLQAVAIDDESYALEVIKAHASKVPFLEVSAYFTNAIEGLEYIKSNPVQVVFLDINMPDLSGIDLAELLPSDVQVIFTTAYSDFAVKGFELNAMDYLLKPFSFPRFLKACQKAQEWISLHESDKDSHLFIKTSEGIARVDFDELLYCESQGNYVNFQLENHKIVSRMTLSQEQKVLPPFFFRTHRSFLANRNLVNRIEKHQLHLKGHTVPISSSYADEVNEIFKNNL